MIAGSFVVLCALFAFHATPSHARPDIALPVGEFIGYPTYSQSEAWMDKVHQAYPSLTKIELIGTSVEKRPVRALCVGMTCSQSTNLVHGDRYLVPQAFYNALHHAREPLGLTTLMVFIKDVFDHYEENNDLHLLESRELWFVFVVNPDGYEFNRVNYPNGGGMQRKNRRPGCNQEEKIGINPATKKNYEPKIGVDLNRNYDFCFDKDSLGSSKDPCREDFEGPHAFSEPETIAIRDFILARNFTVAFNYHSFGKAMYIPYSCKPEAKSIPSADDLFFRSYAKQLTRVNHYTWGQPWNKGLYSVNGDAADWMYHERNIFAVSPEVAPKDPVPSDAYGFWPPKSGIEEWAKENLHMNYRGAWASGAVFGFESYKSTIQLFSNFTLSVDVILKNEGLRDSFGNVQVSVSVEGAESSTVEIVNLFAPIRKKEMEKLPVSALVNFQFVKKGLLRRFLDAVKPGGDGLGKRKKKAFSDSLSLIDGKTIVLAVRDDVHCEIFKFPIVASKFKDAQPLPDSDDVLYSEYSVKSLGDEADERISVSSTKCKDLFKIKDPDAGKNADPCIKRNSTHGVMCQNEVLSDGGSAAAIIILIAVLFCAFGFVFFRAYERQYLWDKARRIADGTSDRGGRGFVVLDQTETTNNAKPILNFSTSTIASPGRGTKIQVDGDEEDEMGINDGEDEVVMDVVSKKNKDDFSLVKEAKIMTKIVPVVEQEL